MAITHGVLRRIASLFMYIYVNKQLIAILHTSLLQKNTFQAVIVADQHMTFVFFIYGDIQWGDTARIGFSAGDGTGFFMVPHALRRQALNIDEGSNVGVTGLYIFRVDQCSVLGPIDGEKPKLLLVVFTIRNIFWANSGEQTLFE